MRAHTSSQSISSAMDSASMGTTAMRNRGSFRRMMNDETIGRDRH